MASLKDVAAAAEVSIRTVSRVLKDAEHVRPHIRTRVLREAKRLGYRPNTAARSLRTGKSVLMTALLPDFDELHLAKVAAFEATLRRRGYIMDLLFANPPGEDVPSFDVIDEVIARYPAGVSIFPSRKIDLQSAMQRLTRAGLHLCTIDGGCEAHDRIEIDRAAGIHEAVLALARRGYRKIAYLGSPADSTRLPGYHQALSDLGRQPLLIETADPENHDQFALGRAAALQYLACPERPDAVQCFADKVALGFLAGLAAHGVSVPGEVGVIGFDDRPAAALASPPLTTVAQPNREAGEQAAELLMNRVETPDGPPQRLVLQPKLMERESTTGR